MPNKIVVLIGSAVVLIVVLLVHACVDQIATNSNYPVCVGGPPAPGLDKMACLILEQGVSIHLKTSSGKLYSVTWSQSDGKWALQIQHPDLPEPRQINYEFNDVADTYSIGDITIQRQNEHWYLRFPQKWHIIPKEDS